MSRLQDTYSTINIRRLTGNIGAVVEGIDAASDLRSKTVSEIRRALFTHKVIFLRKQKLTYDDQVSFARRFGDLTLGHPIFRAPEKQPFLRVFDSLNGTRANHWHTDLTFLDRPPSIALLYSVVVPEIGGDTIWANSATTYAGLPSDLRDLVDRIRIVHSNDSDYIDDTVDSGRLDYISEIYEAEHAAVQIHPETGERILVVGGFAKRVVGYNPQSSRDLLRMLQDYLTKPEHSVRWKWEVGDLAIWDNIATQHYAVCDYGSAHRRNERVTIAGRTPVGVDGRPSVMVRGVSPEYCKQR